MRKSFLSKFIPNEYHKNIYEIDYESLYSSGHDILFFDLDNTIADYNTHSPMDDAISLMKRLKTIGFTVFLLSNNKEKRVKCFADSLGISGFYSLRKPLTGRIKKYILDESFSMEKIVWIGDQAVTDIKCADALGIYSIMVYPINESTDRWYTRFNRKIERIIMRSVKKNLSDEYRRLGLEERYERS